jgi:hypothetical protein
MANELDTIYKALRPVPEFDGNPHILTRFIKICDKLVASYILESPEYELSNLALLNGILNKITGPAALTINSNGIPENWIGIRNILVNNFSDQRDETTLYNDLSLQTQGNSSPQEFYDKCQSLFSTIMTYVTLHESIPTTITAKRDLYKKLTMQVFVRGLKEPLGSRIRCMRPETIEKALEFVQEELNVMYLQQRNSGLSRPNILPYTNPKPQSNFMPTMPYNNQPAFRTHTNHAPAQRPFAFSPMTMQQRPLPPPQQAHGQFRPPTYPPRHMPSRTQQMFGAPPPNYSAHSNAFRLPPKNQYPNPGPKPMSGVSHFAPKPLPPSGWNWMRQGNPPPSNYFKSRDVNVNEFYNLDDIYYYPECHYDYNDSYQYYDYTNDCANYNEYCYDYNQPSELTEEDDSKPVEALQASTSEDFPKASTSRNSR